MKRGVSPRRGDPWVALTREIVPEGRRMRRPYVRPERRPRHKAASAIDCGSPRRTLERSMATQEQPQADAALTAALADVIRRSQALIAEYLERAKDEDF